MQMGPIGGAGQQRRAQPDGVEHIGLLQFQTPRLLANMRGLEASHRWAHAPRTAPLSVEPKKKFPDLLTVKRRPFTEAVE